MAKLTIRIAESLHQSVRELAEQDGVSINQFINTALAEKISALQTAEYCARRAGAVNESTAAEDWNRILAQVPNVEPEAHDRFPLAKHVGEGSQQDGRS